MMKNLAMGAVMVLAASAASAQDSSNKVASNTDWHVFEQDNLCWAVSLPKETVNTDSEGRNKSVRRGEILLLVTFTKGTKSAGQISFAGGYPFASSSDVNMAIGGSSFALFTEGESAWSVSDEEDSKIVAAMKRGAAATLTGRSARGTVTKDTFSLLGFTASIEDAAKRCGS